MEDLLTTLIEPLVTDIKKVKIDLDQDGKNYRFLVSVPKDDIAKVIGKSGKMIKSIKNLLKIRAIKENVFASVEVQEV
ncbi:MAG: KH domain-containing protein [Patescibacteria group bacterium]